MWRGALAIVGSFDDDLVAGVGQAVEGAVAQNRVVKKAEPFVDGPVAGDDEAGRPVPVEDKFIQIGGLLGVEPVQPQVVADEQVWRQEGPEAGAHRVVDPARDMALKKSSAWLKRMVYPARMAE